MGGYHPKREASSLSTNVTPKRSRRAFSPGPERATIILHSGSYDRVSYALSLANIALASEMEVHILLTYGGLRRFTRGHVEDLGEETSPQFRDVVARRLRSKGIESISGLLANARTLGLRLYACPNAMAALNIAHSELAPEVDEVMGLAAFLSFARGASANWYI